MQVPIPIPISAANSDASANAFQVAPSTALRLAARMLPSPYLPYTNTKAQCNMCHVSARVSTVRLALGVASTFEFGVSGVEFTLAFPFGVKFAFAFAYIFHISHLTFHISHFTFRISHFAHVVTI